ncbi:hypothetical protein ACJJTC_005633 [Scirpophaga incertulas]
MMLRPVQLMFVMLSVALAAPASYDDYTITIPRKRAALVLDRLLIALQKALHENPPNYERLDSDGPRFAPLRISNADTTGLQRRGQPGGVQGVRGRVLRCYFNAVTCF